MVYEKFLEKNSTIETRIEGILSILSPDPKGIALWGMETEKPYNEWALYTMAQKFSGGMPINKRPMWQYFNGFPSLGYDGALYKIGAVVKVRETFMSRDNVEIEYILTDAGEYIGKRAVALGTKLVNKLEGKTEYASMWRLIGAARSPGKTRRMLAVYRVVEELIKEDSPLREIELVERTGLSQAILFRLLQKLGYSNKKPGIIDYESPQVDNLGKKATGWARYKIKENLRSADPEEVYEKLKSLERKYISKAKFINAVKTIINSSDEEFTLGSLAEKLNEPVSNISNIAQFLPILSDLDYLEESFRGGKTQSRVSANEYTKIFWRDLLEPVGVVAHTLDTNFLKFKTAFEYYSSNPSEMESDVKSQLRIYNDERSHIGQEGGEIVRRLILDALSEKPKKLSQIGEEVNLGYNKQISSVCISLQLKNLIKKGVVNRVRRGFYSSN